MRGISLFVLIQLICSMTYAESQPKVQVTADKSELLIGDLLHLTLTFERPKDSKVEEPRLEKYIQAFELKDFKISEKKMTPDKIRTAITYTLVPFQAGDFSLGPIAVKWTPRNENPQEIMTEPILIHVKSLIDSSVQNPDIRGPKPLLNIARNFFWIYLILAIAIFLGLGAWILARKTKVFHSELRILPKLLSPSEEALLRLEQLELSDDLKTHKMKIIYSLLSDILRQYLGRRFQYNALEMTTLECLKELKIIKLPFETLDEIRTLLNESDLVKFAKYAPDPSLAPGHIKNAKGLVRKTTEESHAV